MPESIKNSKKKDIIFPSANQRHNIILHNCMYFYHAIFNMKKNSVVR